mmetsp:Transcript_11541/g.27931  ORF Transcript_11541/g.27931 Transcript_11541/m.27931 type:complete len:405 (+) Transcript_11541:160-1374(+)
MPFTIIIVVCHRSDAHRRCGSWPPLTFTMGMTSSLLPRQIKRCRRSVICLLRILRDSAFFLRTCIQLSGFSPCLTPIVLLCSNKFNFDRQTCHAYCTYCFRWAQFIGDDELRFAQKEAQSLFDYLEKHQEVSDILMTGGDPMIMRTSSLAQYLEPLTDPDFLPHVQNLRIGTRSLSFWPQRFTTDKDADELIDLLRRVREDGGRHIAIMAHLGHDRELSTKKFEDAVYRIQKEAFATIRSQSPIMRGINDDSEVWAKKWRKEVKMGIIPYYMFMARDTGAQHYFDVPMAKAHALYSDALRNCSGLIRTARGPSMSCTPGKVEVTGVEEIFGHKAFVMRFLQCRDEGWIGRPFFAKYNPKAVWFDDLEPLPGMELPWDEKGLPRPVPGRIYDEEIQVNGDVEMLN